MSGDNQADPVAAILKLGTALDWVTPTASLGQAVFLHREPVFVCDGWEHEAAELLGVNPNGYSFFYDAWIFMVDDSYETRCALDANGIPYV